MRLLDAATRIRVVSALVEGCSIRATCRMTGVAKGTVLKLLADLGTACRAYHDERPGARTISLTRPKLSW